jgi:hypothetical protein
MEKQERNYVNAEGKFLGIVKRPGNGWLGMESSGSEFVRVPVLVTDEGPQKGREIVWKGYLTEKAVERTLKTLNDIFGSDWTMAMLEDQVVEWPGTEVRVTVEGQEYNGETRYKVRWLNPAKGIAVAMEADRIKVLDAKLAEVRGVAPTPMFEAKPKPAAESDDIPF